MKTSDYFYDLPKELIAQTPLEPRDSSRLLVLDRESGKIEHKHFYDIADFLSEGDCLILNNSRVLPARIYGTKEDTGANVEFLLLRHIESKRWEALAKPGRKAKQGTSFVFGDGIMRCTVADVTEDGNRIIDFECEGNFYEALDKLGQMPLPPYITKKLEDKSRYQTVYAHENGSAAAPTAGLHFTEELLSKIEAKGVVIADVLLHVGLGTFRPVSVENIEEHHMHSEYYECTEEAAEKINNARKNGGRIVAVGTTSCRTLESITDENGIVHAGSGNTEIFITPGYRFKAVDALITNFHLPESTLLMLISAFCSREEIMRVYEHAVKERYRFFSFGDACFFH
ncbi:MAG: tRNA preQ1(34) S-adenosylmethionine ribosyltransferase-isomerase QueA [Clostridia bacterium]|nr:tRNA preQ1(34) S-adenosylmethionine ribosyltransferase-isomerase QueA [Clostridia bacterium]